MNPSDQQQHRPYSLIQQNCSSSNRNSETTGTSEEELRPSTSKQQRTPNWPLDRIEIINPKPAPLIYYKTTQAQLHPPVKARMVMIEDEAELRRQTIENGILFRHQFLFKQE